ncbi:MAG: hypothetical protein IIX54_06120 [Clostridia bacterium]|nr:hypothetical protein [Clostridia bacterium]
MKSKVILLLIFTFILSLCACDSQKTNINEPDVKNSNFVLIIEDNTLCLKDNEMTVKKYETNISVLPSEDILILTNGIEVENIAEADSIAENFDG